MTVRQKEKLMGRSPLDTAFGSASTQEKRSKKGFAYVALLGVAGLASASSVFAANVSINSDAAISYAQGTTTIAACDTDGIEAALGATFDTDAFALDTITLSGIDDDCGGKNLVVTLYAENEEQVIVTKTGITLTPGEVADDNVFVIGTAGDPLAAGDGVVYQDSQTAALLAGNADRITIEIND
jgi:hypothetical protein